MDATEMEVEGATSSPVSTSSKRFGLKNSIKTNFGDDYVFQITAKEDCTAMAVSLSTNLVKLYSPTTGQFLGDCRGHTNTINQIGFSSSKLTPHLLHSCSSDGTIRTCDTRNFQQVSVINAGHGNEVFSFSFEGEGNLLAGGCKSQVLLWDCRNGKQVACLEESHVEDITQVHFIPQQQNKLLSASVDGLMCIFDTTGDINDDDNLDSVMNVGTSIGRVGFFGNRSEKLWCLTHIETISIWDWKDSKAEVEIQDARSVASESWNRDHVDYFVDCHSCDQDNRLWVIGGTNAGTVGYFPITYGNGKGVVGPVEAILEGGHMGIVRSVLPLSKNQLGSVSQNGIFGWTGGEDGRLCSWLSDENCEINKSWISSELVMKSPKTRRKKSRHSPY